MMGANYYLIASDNVQNDKHVSSGDKPARFLKRDKDVIVNSISECPITDECHREVAYCHNNISYNNTAPHGLLGRLLWCGRDGGLDLQHDIVTRICKCHRPERVKEAKYGPGIAFCFVTVVYIRFPAFVN